MDHWEVVAVVGGVKRLVRRPTTSQQRYLSRLPSGFAGQGLPWNEYIQRRCDNYQSDCRCHMRDPHYCC